MIYTAVDYLYRDAANYKVFGKFWLLGTLTDDEFKAIRDACEGGDLRSGRVGLHRVRQRISGSP
ncbi:hypothetical protein, partial [Novosphingobium sp. CCH12-A3]|uniref:hypothetical protein n=1 Tax=Novosphingobium sp. CCH12-A3 TaxID=1768752 RepID=UPI000B13C8B3